MTKLISYQDQTRVYAGSSQCSKFHGARLRLLQQPRHWDQLRVRVSRGEGGGRGDGGEGEGRQEQELQGPQAQQRCDRTQGPLERNKYLFCNIYCVKSWYRVRDAFKKTKKNVTFVTLCLPPPPKCKKIQCIFSCEDTALQVLMYVYLCVCRQVEILPYNSIQNFAECCRMFKNNN